MPQTLSNRKENISQGGYGCGGGVQGLIKVTFPSEVWKLSLVFQTVSGWNMGNGEKTFILPMGYSQNPVDFTSCLGCFLFTSDISKREEKALPPFCASAFSIFFPLLFSALPSLPLPVLCTHCSACSSGETEKIALLLIR